MKNKPLRKVRAWLIHPKGKTMDACLVTTQFIVAEWHKQHVVDSEVVECEIHFPPNKRRGRR